MASGDLSITCACNYIPWRSNSSLSHDKMCCQ